MNLRIAPEPAASDASGGSPGPLRAGALRSSSRLIYCGIMLSNGLWAVSLNGLLYLSGMPGAELIELSIVELLIFGVLNLAGACYLSRLADDRPGLSGPAIARRHSRLLSLSALWIALLGVLTAALLALGEWEAGSSVRAMLDVVLDLSYIFWILLPVYTIFALDLFIARLRRESPPERYASSSGGLSLGYKLILFAFALALGPYLINVFQVLLGVSGPSSRKIVIDTVMVFVAGAGLTALFAQQLRLSLKSLLHGHRRIGTGAFDARVPALGDGEIGELAMGFNRMAGDLQERERARSLLGMYVSQNVAEEIMKSPANKPALGGETRYGTVLFSDIASYTATVERLNPEQVVDLMNEYFRLVVAIIEKHGGVVNKFIGDSVMALFGVPVADEDHALRAVLAAREIRALCEERRFGDDLRLRTRVGVSTGAMIAGSIGSESRMEYTVLGDTVNIAARLEQLNKRLGSGILLSAATQAAIESTYAAKDHNDSEVGRVMLRAVGRVRLRGKREAIQIFSVADTRPGELQ